MILKGKTQEEVDKEKQISELHKIINEAKKRLSETDWIVIKLNEYTIKGQVIVESLMQKYQSILDERVKLRETINEVEQRLEEIK